VAWRAKNGLVVYNTNIARVKQLEGALKPGEQLDQADADTLAQHYSIKLARIKLLEGALKPGEQLDQADADLLEAWRAKNGLLIYSTNIAHIKLLEGALKPGEQLDQADADTLAQHHSTNIARIRLLKGALKPGEQLDQADAEMLAYQGRPRGLQHQHRAHQAAQGRAPGGRGARPGGRGDARQVVRHAKGIRSAFSSGAPQQICWRPYPDPVASRCRVRRDEQEQPGEADEGRRRRSAFCQYWCTAVSFPFSHSGLADLCTPLALPQPAILHLS